MDLGIIANDLNDLTPVADALLVMLEVECREYVEKCRNPDPL